MKEVLTPNPGDMILCQRKSYKDAVTLGGVIFGVLTLGLGFLLLYGIYGLVPRQIWVKDSRIFADKILPQGGVPFDSIAKVTIRTVNLTTSVEIARTAEIEIIDQGKRYLMAINRNYYPKEQVERTVDFFLNAKGS